MTSAAAHNLQGYFASQRRDALAYVMQARDTAMSDGIEMESFAQAAIFLALKEMIDVYGEEAVSAYASRLPARIGSGEFSASPRNQ